MTKLGIVTRAAGCALAAVVMSVGVASAEEVLSANAVGYVTISDVQGGDGEMGFYLVAHPFENMDGSEHSITNVFAAVPNGSVVSVWDAAEQVYVSYTKSGRGDWLGDAVTATIGRGEAAFLRIPANAPPFDLMLMGEVPAAAETQGFHGQSITMVGYPYPATEWLTNTVMAAAVPNGTVIAVWDGDAQEYVSYTKSGRGEWLGDALTAQLTPGQGFVIRTPAVSPPDTWQEIKPYTWP